jgi:cellulose synthase/poly-beta-1,6-N-acetylglucosamine synthase-like glycosyltransferase
MAIAFLAQASAIVAFACAAVLLCFVLGDVYLVVLHLVLRRDGLAGEAALLAQSQPAESTLPHVVVQITVCNEGSVVTRAVGAAVELDWPRDRLHIQICDDSDDSTTELARAAIASFAHLGIDIQLLRRSNRSDFKAGNLRAAMAETPYDYFAIFDVDYVMPRDFLRKCMPPLIADPALAFVQARPDFLNANESATTRAAALHLDAHHAIEQATRCWARHPLQFNGTCGIWRRAAIEASGGWSGATMLEDVDLGYRAAIGGWRALFLTSVFVPGELPSTPPVWLMQQRRWQIGLRQNARTHVPRLMTARKLPMSARIGGILHLGTIRWVPWATKAMLISAFVAAVLEPHRIPLLLLVLLGLLVVAHVEQIMRLWIGQRSLRGSAVPFRRFVANFIELSTLTVSMELPGPGMNWLRPTSRKDAFRRTPTTGQLGFRSNGAARPEIAPPDQRA